MSQRNPNRPPGASAKGGPPSDASVLAAAVAEAGSDPTGWRDELALAVRETCRRWTKLVSSDTPIDTLELGALVQAAVDGAKRLTTHEGVSAPVKLATVTPIRPSALEAGKR